MQFHRSLRFRVAFTFAWFGALVSLLLAAGLFVAAHDLGERLLDETLTAELQDYMARRARNPHSLPPATLSVVGFVWPHASSEPAPPAAVQALPPGQHELSLNDRLYRVAVVDREGARFFMLHDATRQAQRERRFAWFLGAGVLIMTLLSAAGGLWLAGRVIAPVTELARRVRGLAPEDRPAPLAADFSADELGELAQVFDLYLARLRAFIDRERAFTADVSHELRTPLAVLQGATEVLLADDTLAQPIKTRIDRMHRAAQDMTELTSALLFLAREAQSRGRDGHCPVADVLNDVVDKHRHLLDDKSVRVALDVRAQPQLAVERALLFIVLGNLVRNAFVHTDRGEVRIVLEADRITVSDTGVGIREDQLDRVFQRHYKGVGSQGAGIGLALVKRICDLHGWTISIDSREGCGTIAQLRFFPPTAAFSTPA